MVALGALKRHYREVISYRYGGRGRPFIDNVVDVLDEEWGSKNVFVVEAPTGYGKTDISLTIAKFSVEEELKAIIAYPLRSLLEQQVGVFRDVLRACGISGDLIGTRYLMNPESPYFIKPVTLTTVDTLALTMLGIAPEDLGKVLSSLTGDGRKWGSMGHYIFSWASAFTSNIVVDEAHLLADSGKALTFVAFLAREAVLHDQHLVVMTATMPPYLPEVIREAVTWQRSRVSVISFSEYLKEVEAGRVKDDFIIERAGKDYVVETMPAENSEEGVKAVVEWVAEACGTSHLRPPRVLMVFNTVGEALKAYRLALRELPMEPERVLLLHSRFTAFDRDRLIRRLDSLTKEVREGRGGEPYAVVATQAVEAGVDVTSNVFATDAAPPTTIVQRAGRFLRYGERVGKALVWWEGDEASVKSGEAGVYKVYDQRLVKATINWIKSSNGQVNLHLPEVPSNLREARPRPGYGDLLARTYAWEGRVGRLVSRKLLANMEDIVTDYMKGSWRAAELLKELGGSFIRDSTLIPVIPESLVSRSEDVLKLSVPVASSTFLKLCKSCRVVGAVIGSEVTPLPEGVAEDLKAAVDCWVRGGKGSINALRHLIRAVVCSGIEAFVVRAEYDPREGLKV